MTGPEDVAAGELEKYKSIFENAVFGIYQTTPDGRFISANDALARILGYSSAGELIEQVKDIGVEVHVDPQRRAEFVAQLESKGSVHNFEAQAKRKDGSTCWISLSGRVLRDESGSALTYEGIVEDITPRKQAEDALRESEERFSAIVRQAIVGVAQFDVTGRFLFANERYCQIVGRSADELLGLHMQDITHPDDLAHNIELFDAMTQGRSPGYVIEKRYVRPDGDVVWVEKTASMVYDTRGKPLYAAAVVQDIGMRKQFEEGSEAARERLSFLADASSVLSSSLEYEATLNNLARLVTERLGDVCSIDMVERDKVRRVAFAHADKTKEALLSGMDPVYRPDPRSGHPVMRVARSRRSELLAPVGESELRASARDERHLEALRALGVKSVMVVPLIAGIRTLGAMTIATSETARPYQVEDLALAEELARRAALAIEHARLYEDTERARLKAEDAANRTAQLQAVTAALSEALTQTEVGTIVVDAAMSAMHAVSGVIAVLTADGKIQAITMKGESDSFAENWAAFADDPPATIIEGIRSGRPVFAESMEDLLKRFPDLSRIPIVPARSYARIPLMVEGRAIGAMVLTFASPKSFSEEDREFILAFAGQCAQALERARLYQAEQAARAAAETAQQRLWFLAEANAVLSSSLDFDTTLSRAASLAVPLLADCCVAHIFPAEGIEARSSIAHIDRAKEALVRQLHERYVPSSEDPHPLMQMIETRAPVLIQGEDESLLDGIAHDEEHRKILESLDFTSYMAVPLIGRGRLFGALTFALSGDERRFSKDDLTLAQELGRRAALALDNAHLYEEANRVQEALRVALEAKDEFLGVMSHELRTPITAIYGGARVLRSRADRLDGDSRTRLIEDMEQESERLFRMVENLLVLSRLELGQEVETEPVLVQRVAEKLATGLMLRRPSRKIEVVMDKGLPPVAAEPSYLEQIMRNLLTNAEKYSPDGSPIEIRARPHDGEMDVWVLDRGHGIAPDEAEKIFERFYRSGRTATQASGLGLGLTVCKRLVEAQAGRVWARPREGGGLEVGLTLPLCKEVD